MRLCESHLLRCVDSDWWMSILLHLLAVAKPREINNILLIKIILVLLHLRL